MTRVFKSVVLLALFAGAPLATAQDMADSGSRYAALIDNIDLLVDNYARYLGQKYELTDEQDAYTRKMLRERTYGFLDQHEDNLRDVIEVMFDVRTGGEISPGELQAWGEQVRPIYEDAKNIIVGANDDWRDILTPDQRLMHDEDLELMIRSFETTEDQLNRIVTGEMTVDEFRNPRRYRHQQRHVAARDDDLEPPPPTVAERNTPPMPPPPPPERITRGVPGEAQAAERDGRGERRGAGRRDRGRPEGIARPNRAEEMNDAEALERAAGEDEEVAREVELPQRGGGPEEAEQPPPPDDRRERDRRAPRSAAGADYEGKWDKYVADFIAKYKLDDEQKQQANSILEDCKSQATRQVQSRVEQIEKREAQLKADDGTGNREQLAKLAEQKREALKPLDAIFENRLKPRLDKLPTRAQRRAAEAETPRGRK